MSAYFTKPDPLARFVLARAIDINSRMDAVETGFDNVFVAVEALGSSIFAAVAEAMSYAEAASNSADEAAASVASIGSSVSTATAAAGTATTQAGIATTQAGIATTQAGLADTARVAAETAETNAETAETNAEAARDLAQEWSSKAEDSAITGNPGFYSALHHAAKAAASASSASSSASTATTQAGLAAAAKTAAETAETNAETAETNAEAAATLAGEWATKAEDSAITGYPGQFSALHHAAKAAASAAAAATWDPANYLPLTAGSGKALTGDLYFSGTGLRIKGDFANATHANRTAFQSSTADAGTVVCSIPNGTAVTAYFQAANSPSFANCSVAYFGINGSGAELVSGAIGSGTTLPLSLRAGATANITLATDGSTTINSTTTVTGRIVVDWNSVGDGGDEQQIAIDGVAGQARGISFRTAGTVRWVAGVTNAAESGSNVGSDFCLWSFADNGAYIGNPFIITRSTGRVLMNSGLSVSGGSVYMKALTTWSNLASSSTPDLGGVASNLVNITGTTTIQGFTGGADGMLKLVRFAGALTLQYGVSLNLPGQASITTAAGDEAIFVCESNTTDWKCISYTKISGGPPADIIKAPIAFRTEEYDNGNSGTSLTIYLNAHQRHKITLTGNLSTFVFSGPLAGCIYTIKIVQGAGPYTITWPSGIKWKGGTAPTLSAGSGDIDIVTIYYDGTSYHAVHDADFAAP